MTPEQRFWKKVDKGPPDQCWLYTGYIQKTGHGQFGVGGKLVYAHRFSAQLSGLPIDDGLVCHKCGNPACVNPRHLYIGDKRTNAKDAMRDGVFKTPAPRYGSSHHARTMTDDQMQEFFIRHENGEMQKDLAREYGVHPDTLSRYWRNRSAA